MRRILQITGTMDRAGAETMIMNLYRYIDKTKFQFDFLYFTARVCHFDKEIEDLGGKIYRISESNALKRMFATIKLLKENEQWEIIHSHTLFSNAFHVYAAYKAGVKRRITHSHNTNSPSKNALFDSIYCFLSRRMQAKFATDFIACSKKAGEFMFPNKENVEIIQNAIDSEKFALISETNTNYIKTNFNVNEEVLILIQVGRLHEQKNYHFSIKIAQSLKKMGVAFKYFFVGDGTLRSNLEDKVIQLGLIDEIIFLGVRNDIACLMAGSDLMLMPSLYEGFGVVLIEAQAVGIPSLVSNTIPKDSDVNLGLLNFFSLEEAPEKWAKKSLEIIRARKTIDKSIRLEALKEMSFDIRTNIQRIERLYEYV